MRGEACLLVHCNYAPDKSKNETETQIDFENVESVLAQFRPGKIILVETLVYCNIEIAVLQENLPIQALVMCVRDRIFTTDIPRGKLCKFKLEHLFTIDESFDVLSVLFSQWGEQLTPAICTSIGLTTEKLLQAKLHKQHVKDLAWSLKRWTELFQIDSDFFQALNIKEPSYYFPDMHQDLSLAIATRKKNKKQTHSKTIFVIDL